jgi:hypothetical protein
MSFPYPNANFPNKSNRHISGSTNLQAAMVTSSPDPFYTPHYQPHIRLLGVGLVSQFDL